MLRVEQIQTEIEALSEKGFAHLRKWLAKRDWERWDSQLEADVAAGKLDFLLEEALSAREQDTLREWVR